MPLVSGLDQARSLRPTKKFGYSGGFGLLRFGYNRFGFYNELCGIYARRHTLKGVQITRMPFYRPTNPQTGPQMAWRAVFATGLSTWGGFTEPQKNVYRVRARGNRMSGFNLFMREYLAANRL